MYMNEKFSLQARPPQEALNTISFGKLKGKSDINPQWRIEALTEVFGLCGVGWYYEIMDVTFVDVPATEEKMVYLTVGIRVKDESGEWSSPVVGVGGDFVIIHDKNGVHGNDEAMQMALTDALGKAAKCLGIASDIYRGKYDSKYGWRDEREKERQAAMQKNQEKLDETENWRIIDSENVQIKGNDGRLYDIKRLSLNQLKLAYTKPEFEGVRKFIDKRIAELVNG